MKILIDDLVSSNNWITNNCVVGETSWDDLDNNYLFRQLQFDFQATGTAYKKYDLDVSNCNLIVFSLFEFYGKDLSIRVYENSANYVEFKIIENRKIAQLSATVLELSANYCNSTFEIACPFSTIFAIEFVSTLGISVILNGMFACKDEYPLDIHLAIKDMLIHYTKDMRKILIGTAKGKTGSDNLTVTGQPQLVERFTAIELDGDVYQIDNVKPLTSNTYQLKFTQNFSGKLLTKDYDTNIYLAFPILVNPQDIEGSDYAISIESGFTPEVIKERSFPELYLFSADKQNNFYLRQSKSKYFYRPVIHALYRNLETKGLLLEILNRLIATQINVIFINGQRHYMECSQLEENEFDNYSGEMTVQCKIELEEFSWYEKPNLIKTVTITPLPTDVLSL